ncbi:nuclear transport factor 2 family protein [Pontibacter chitinilyticus]|uniref:nuclear transport factor 2 family protein n=1 Tax=Pontibacter chitinilyticus TaxID=2674989 RepID=UPI00321B563B
MQHDTQKQQLIEHYINAYNRFDVAGMVKDLHPDIAFENISNGTTNLRLPGISAFKKQAEQAARYFREREQRVKSIYFSHDVAALEIDYTGIVAVDMPNGMKAGATISLQGRSMFYFKDEKIIKIQDIS